MSVINKMLRDLDQRQAGAGEVARAGVRPLGSLPELSAGRPGARPWPAVVGGGVVLVALAAAAAWWLSGGAAAPGASSGKPPPQAAPAATPAPAAKLPDATEARSAAPAAAYPWLNGSATETHAQKLVTGQPLPAGTLAVASAAPVGSAKPAPLTASAAPNLASAPAASVAVATRPPAPLPPGSAAKSPAAPPAGSGIAGGPSASLASAAPAGSAPTPGAAPAASPARSLAPVAAAGGSPGPALPPPAPAAPLAAAAPAPLSAPSSALSPAPAPTPAPSSAAAPAPAATGMDSAQRQLQAGRDALAQAQTLWNGGGKETAIDLLQQATLSAERNQASNPSPAGRQLLLTMVRELSRMQLADGRPAAAYELVSRAEGSLAGEPDLLALRANAAQRMGRHQDSVNAYRAALQYRPTEQRWLLGAAVSLAALGQTAAATDMADKARQVGPISREVQAYLKQAGVVVRE